MKHYRPSDLERFLRCVDKHLPEPRELLLIGGAAASLAYGVSRTTTDIDTNAETADLAAVLQAARDETGLDIPLQTVRVWDAPYNYEERIETVDLGLSRLRILVPEKHDLVLMKTVRGQENDRDAITQMAASVRLDKATLVDRFKNEMSHVVGRPDQIRANFLVVIELLYGEDEADRVEAGLTAS